MRQLQFPIICSVSVYCFLAIASRICAQEDFIGAKDLVANDDCNDNMRQSLAVIAHIEALDRSSSVVYLSALQM